MIRLCVCVIFFSILSFEQVFAQTLKNGDLIFQESRSDDRVGDAIKSVTKSTDNYNFTHVGIVYIPHENDTIYVIEATPPNVQVVPLNDFLHKGVADGSIPISVVGRLKDEYQQYIPMAIDEALKLVGKEYDYGFDLSNDKYYCSELIYDIFLKANNGNPIFDLNIMTFKSKDSDETDQNWIRYFGEKNLSIPEGEMGINPGAMSLSNKISILREIEDR